MKSAACDHTTLLQEIQHWLLPATVAPTWPDADASRQYLPSFCTRGIPNWRLSAVSSRGRTHYGPPLEVLVPPMPVHSFSFLISPPGHQSSTRPLPRKACPLSPPPSGDKWDSKRPARKRDGYMCNRYGKTCGINYVVTPGPLYSCLLVNRGRLALLNVCCVELSVCLVSLRTGDE